MKHEDAWKRLPDLLEERDDAPLLAHVRECAECQRQVFLLGRVDRLLRDNPDVVDATQPRRRTRWRLAAVAATLAAAVTATTLSLFVLRSGESDDLVLRTASGRSVAQAVIGDSDPRNASLALDARGMPVERGHMFVLWAGSGSSTMRVGQFMVDENGNCRVQFSLPATHPWHRFWVTEPGNAAAVIAST